MRALFVLVFVSWLALGSAPSWAQPESLYGELRYAGDTRVEVVVDGHTRVVVGGRTVPIDGSRGATTYSGASDEGVLLALLRGDGIAVVFVPVRDGRAGRPSAPRRVSRSAGAERTPVGAAIAPTPDGFAVFWQEADTRNPGAAYETYLATLDPRGVPRGETKPVPAVWPLAAAAFMPESNRFYFLVFYGGADPRGTRLCGVHVDATTLRPQEHPWWASRPGAIDEAQLFVRGERVTALYRGGPDGDRLLEVDVSNGGWAQEADAATRRGSLGPSGVFGGRVVEGRLRVVTAPRPGAASAR